jgi:predicted amidohydrolase
MILSAILSQFPVSSSIQTNLEAIVSALDTAQPGDLVIFPEACVSGYSIDTSFLSTVNIEESKHALSQIQKEAIRRQIHIWVGACIREEGKWFNAAYGFTQAGEVHTYYKVNLATHERGFLWAGSELPVFNLATPAGTVKVGVQMCRELRFPEQWRLLAHRGAQLILHMDNATGDDHYQSVWRSHLISRAAETQRFVLSVNNAAPKQICPTMAIGPDGLVLGEIVSAWAENLRVSLDLTQVSDYYLNQSRMDIAGNYPKENLN